MTHVEAAATVLGVKRKFDPGEPELMDRPQPVSVELERDLCNLRQLNRFFGSYALVRRFLRCWLKPGRQYRVLDLATGSGDIPRLVVDYARSIAATVQVHALERQAATLQIAEGLSESYPEISFAQADILTWDSSERFDVVLCSLVLHHFSETDAVVVLRRARELSRDCVLVSDLRRGWLATAGVYLLTALIFREPMTRYDGRVSAARAFSFEELHALASDAGWRNFGHRPFRFARQAIWLKQAASDPTR